MKAVNLFHILWQKNLSCFIFERTLLFMKKIFPLLVVVFVVFISSCTQEYICQCVVKYSGNPPGLPDSAVHEFPIKNTKKNAAKDCEANNTSVTENGITMDEKCQLY
jgi:hypothetical protein